jgi:hypothetical protein
MEVGKIIVIIFYFICLYIFLHTYYYLDQIDNCPCFHKDGKYAVNIDFMKFFQILEIFILTVYLVSIFFFSSKMFKSKNKKAPLVLLFIAMAFLLTVSGAMTFNVINFYNNVKEDCKCVDSWYRYFIYYEGIVSFITVFRFISVVLLLTIFFIMSKFN